MGRPTRRVCTTHGCPVIHAGRGKCPTCRAHHEAIHYGPDYWAARDTALQEATHCFRCGNPFTPDNPATGGHLVPIREGGTTADGVGAECRRCNYGRRET